MAPKINRIDAMLFAVTVLAWGTTWYVILGQFGVVHPIVSVGWRFLLASITVVGICRFRGERLALTPNEHALCAILGLFLFCLNYGLFYTASLTLTTGLISVVFSTMVFWNALGAYWFLKQPLDYRALLGGGIGVLGLIILFRVELLGFSWVSSGSIALLLSLLGTLAASVGNLVSAILQKRDLNVWNSTAFGMMYGTAITFMFAFINGYPIRFDFSPTYLASLLYLVFIGSVVAFGSYLTLIGRIGPGRAAYATVSFPVVAIVVSVLFEGYELSLAALFAFCLVMLGNWLALTERRAQKSPCRA